MEKLVRRLVMTPRLHGIHHSIVDEERGLSSHRDRHEVSVGKVLLLPFKGTKLAQMK